MPEIADVLERESSTVDLEQGDFERLLGRRERKQRNRRIRAGALGVTVALAAGIFLVRALTSSPTPANPPEPRPVGGVSGALAYDKDGHIYIADPDGSNAVKIAGRSASCGGGPSDLEPSWSPDGRYLAFLRGCTHPVLPLRHVVVISYPDAAVVAEFPTRGGFVWSPDSTRIAVWGGQYGQTLDVYGVDGSQQASLPNPLPDGQTSGIMWMPDGSSLLLYRNAYVGSPSEMVVPMDVVPLDGSPAAELPGGLPVASPDGTRVALVSGPSTVVTDADGTQLFEVDRHLDGVVWSPDGARFAATVGPFGREKNVVVVDAVSGEVTELTEARAALLRYRKNQRRIEGVVGFSPDGERIMYSGWGTSYTPKAIYSIDVDGSNPHALVKWAQSGQWRPV